MAVYLSNEAANRLHRLELSDPQLAKGVLDLLDALNQNPNHGFSVQIVLVAAAAMIRPESRIVIALENAGIVLEELLEAHLSHEPIQTHASPPPYLALAVHLPTGPDTDVVTLGVVSRAGVFYPRRSGDDE